MRKIVLWLFLFTFNHEVWEISLKEVVMELQNNVSSLYLLHVFLNNT